MIFTNYFEDFSEKQLVGLFSCFTDVNVAKDVQVSVPCNYDMFLRKKINELRQTYNHYQAIELEYDVRTGYRYEDALMYDIIDYTMEWCDCSSEIECKELLAKLNYNCDVSIGDFTKAMLKIATITRELMNVCEKINHVALLHKLSKIEGMVLKYITTCQSLYI